MFTFKIFDDIALPQEADAIENYCLTNMPWWYQRNISGVSRNPNTPIWVHRAEVENGFASKIYERGTDVDENAFNLIYPIIDRVKSEFPFETFVARVRGGMFMPAPTGGCHTPHVDMYRPHYTLLYYVNDSDGDTILWNEKVTKDSEEYPDRFTIMGRVSPEKGRAVLFNGLHYHSSSIPKRATERIAININLLTTPL